MGDCQAGDFQKGQKKFGRALMSNDEPAKLPSHATVLSMVRRRQRRSERPSCTAVLLRFDRSGDINSITRFLNRSRTLVRPVMVDFPKAGGEFVWP